MRFVIASFGRRRWKRFSAVTVAPLIPVGSLHGKASVPNQRWMTSIRSNYEFVKVGFGGYLAFIRFSPGCKVMNASQIGSDRNETNGVFH